MTVCLTPRWSQRRLLLHFTFVRKFTVAVIRAVAQLWIVRRHEHHPRVILFGATSGLIWSLALALQDGFDAVGADTLVPGILSGVLVSLALKKPLAKCGRLGAFIAGLLSLPLGAFLFGFLASLYLMLVGIFTGGDYGLHPILSGLYCAAVSVASLFALYLLCRGLMSLSRGCVSLFRG